MTFIKLPAINSMMLEIEKAHITPIYLLLRDVDLYVENAIIFDRKFDLVDN